MQCTYALCGKLEIQVANMDPPGASNFLCDLDTESLFGLWIDSPRSKVVAADTGMAKSTATSTGSRSNFGSTGPAPGVSFLLSQCSYPATGSPNDNVDNVGVMGWLSHGFLV